MATVVEDPDLFKGIEITEMDDLNMENGDEYVFIPSDNENEEESGASVEQESLNSQSIFHRLATESAAEGPLIRVLPEVISIDEISDQVIVAEPPNAGQERVVGTIDLVTETESYPELVDEDGKNIDLSQEEQVQAVGDEPGYVIKYDINLDSQDLINIESRMDDLALHVINSSTEEIEAVTIKEEIEIEDAVVNFPDEDEVLFDDEFNAHVDHDVTNLGSEVVTLDSDAAESEDEEDCVLLSLIGQCPSTIKKEKADTEKTPVENDHAYTSQPLEEPPGEEVSATKPDANMKVLVGLYKRVLNEAGPSSVTNFDETLRSIVDIEEQIKSLKEKILSTHPEKQDEQLEPEKLDTEGEILEPEQQSEDPGIIPPLETPVPPPPLVPEKVASPSRHESCDADNLSIVLSENCSERLECHSLPDLTVSISDENEQPAVVKQLRKQSSDGLSKTLTYNHSEPLEHESVPMEYDEEANDKCDKIVEKEVNHVQENDTVVHSEEEVLNTDREEHHDKACAERRDDDDSQGTNDKENEVEKVCDEGPSGSAAQPCLNIKSIDELITYGELFTKECESWLEKVNIRKRNDDIPNGDATKEADAITDDQCERIEQFLLNLRENIVSFTNKIPNAEQIMPISSNIERVEVSVQTEKRKLTAEKARALNEKYKKRLLSSLAEAEIADSDLSDDGDSFDSAGEVSSEAIENEEEDDDEAFEQRQNRRRTKRLKQLELQESMHQEEEEQIPVAPGKKRNTRRLSSTETADDIKYEDGCEEIFSEPDLSQFLIPKSPTSSIAASSDTILVKNELFSENDSEPVGKRIMRTDSVEYDTQEPMDHEEISIKDELSSTTPSQGNLTEHKSLLNTNELVLKAEEDEGYSNKPEETGRSVRENDKATHKTTDDDNEQADKDDVSMTEAEPEQQDQSDSELLDDVLPQVDDILLDVDDILPAAEGVVQDYLVEEEVRTEHEEESKKETKEPKKEKQDSTDRTPTKAGKTIDSEEEVDSEQEEKEKTNALDHMTESELEEYYDNLREREIDKLCNLANLEVARNIYPQKPQEVKKKPVVVKKKDRVIDDILNSSDIHHESEESESDTEVLETEELFLQKCNDNMKHQLLNQLSSSDTEQESGSEDSVVQALREKRDYDSDDSAGSILMEKFLKSLDKDREDSVDEESKEKKQSDADGLTADKESDASDHEVENETDKSKENEKDFLDDSAMPEMDNEDAMTKLKERLKKDNREQKTDTTTTKERGKSNGTAGPTNRTTSIDPIDKQLFSKKMFKEVDETLRKDREREAFSKENGSITDRSERIASDDSDVELLDVSMFQPKRKLKEKSLENFDFSASAKRATPQMKRKDLKDDDCISLSSESEAEVEEGTTENTEEKENKKRNIRAMLTQDQLADDTKNAQKDEEQRVSRLRRKNEHLRKFLATFKPGPDESNLVLDYDSKTSQAICVHPDIVKLLKPHQREGIKFMYDNCYGSIDYINKNSGSGCILAHCMGLGKTLQLITLLHTVMRYPQLKTKRVLVICPKSTVMNWSDEIQQWLGSLKSGPRLKVFYFPDNSDVNDKLKVLSDWYSSTTSRCGCMLIGYEAFRILVNYEKRKRTPSNILAAKAAFVKKKVDEYLLSPGADLVICDEGHQIKNKKSAISGAVSQIKTRRRIVLTGTPIQNNLKEYYCMVNFIKPSFLGSDREFNNLYANPIKNGQHKDSDSRAIKIMKQRSYVLHNKLSKFVQRREAGVLKEFLPEKFEYVLFVPLTPVQEKMYEVFLQMNEYTTPVDAIGDNARGKKFKLLADYTSLRKIWTHPKVLEKAWETAVQEKSKRDARFRHTSTPDSDDDRPDDYNDISSGALSVTNDWWRKHLGTNDLESLYPSNKLRVMFEILKQCEERGEKCLIFSAFVAVLNVVEHFMAKINNREKDPLADVYGYCNFKGPWEAGKDYYRLDGKTQKNIRHKMITSFNDASNKRTKCFLISAKAGGQGINLIGANRVIILDTSWNPSNDQQNIFRIFRLGQKRKCFVYRLLAMGTMEEKVYSRSVTKQAMSFRVVDEQQIDRHYSFSELAELYSLSKVADQVRETPILPADDLLASLLRNYPNCVFKYHEHDSLLENKPEQDLSEEEKKEAWAAYEREIQNNEKPSYLGNLGMMPNFMGPGFPGAPGSALGPYSSMNYAGITGALADMYRSDFGYGPGMSRLMYPYSNQPFQMMNDPTYSSIMGKPPPYPSFNMPGTSGGMPDYGMSTAMNSQGAPGSASYNSTVALQSLLDLYAKSMTSGLGSSAITTATATSVSPTTSTSPAAMSPYNALSSLKQFNGFTPLPPVSGPPVPHSSSPQLPPPPVSSTAPIPSGNTALINMLNDQPMPMSSAASSGPFSHLNSPLPAPSISLHRSPSMPSAVTTMASSSPVLTTAALANTSSPITTHSVTQPAVTLTRPPPPKPSAPTNNDIHPVALTTTVVASDDDVDDDGVPRPHIIVRDPTSINASSAKAQETEKVVKKINMGIVYPEEKIKSNTKDIMLSAKSITNLSKPTIAVKNVESMKAHPSMVASKNSPSLQHSTSRPGSSNSRPIRASPVQSPLSAGPKLAASRAPHHQIRRSSPSNLSPGVISKTIPSPRQQQVPVITSAKALQLASMNPQNTTASYSSVPPRVSNVSTTTPNIAANSAQPSSTGHSLPRGAIAAQQLRELQQRMNVGGTSTAASLSSSNNLVVAKPKKSVSQLVASHHRSTAAKQQPVHPVGLFASPSANLLQSQKLQKASVGSSPNSHNAARGMKNESVSITKITSSGQRIAMNMSQASAGSTGSSSSSSGSSGGPVTLQGGSGLARKQDLVITKTTPGTAVARKLPGSTSMLVKSQDISVSPSIKRNFQVPSSSTIKSIGAAPHIVNPSGSSLPPGSASSITVRKRKAEPTLIDSLKAKNNSITISEVRSIYQPPAAKKANQGPPIQAQKRLGSGITITPRKPTAQQQQQNVLEVVEIE